jgi:hypothetical protein
MESINELKTELEHITKKLSDLHDLAASEDFKYLSLVEQKLIKCQKSAVVSEFEALSARISLFG